MGGRGCQALRGGGTWELLFTGWRVSVLQDIKCSGDGWWGWLQSNMIMANTTDLYTRQWLRWYFMLFVFYHHQKKKKKIP